MSVVWCVVMVTTGSDSVCMRSVMMMGWPRIIFMVMEVMPMVTVCVWSMRVAARAMMVVVSTIIFAFTLIRTLIRIIVTVTVTVLMVVLVMMVATAVISCRITIVVLVTFMVMMVRIV